MSFVTIAESRSKALPPPLPVDRLKFRYAWPDQGIFDAPAWQHTHDQLYRVRHMPESRNVEPIAIVGGLDSFRHRFVSQRPRRMEVSCM